MVTLAQHAKRIRRKIIDTAYKYQCGHVGSALSCVGTMTGIFFNFMKRGDIFILSAGHKALVLYAVLWEKGLLKDINMHKLGEHPKKNKKLGIPVSTGSLGHGLSLAAGFALANPKKTVYVLLSEGDVEEGSTLEAINFISFYNIENICVFVDRNGWTAYKKVLTTVLDDYDFINNVYTKKGAGLKRFEDKLESHYWHITKEDYEEAIR